MERAERRRRLKDDQRLVARGLTTEDVEPKALMALMRVFHALIEESRDARTLTPLMAYFHDNMRAAGQAGPRKALACRMGCAHCCHAWVSARAPEVLFVKRSIPVREREAVCIAVEEAYAVTGLHPPEVRDRMGTPCPLLAGGLCRAYAARPAVCQTAVSLNAAPCAKAWLPGAEPQDIPTPDFYIAMRAGYSIALAGALRRAGLPAAAYEYNGALRAAFAREDAEATWLAGEDVFEGVQPDPVGDPFDRPGNRRLYELAFSG